MEADAKASGSAVMARIAMAQEATVNRLEADRAALTRPARPKVLLDAPLRWEDTAQRIEAVVRAWRRFPLEVQRASLRSSCRPVLNPPDGLLEDPRRWEWNWGQSGS